MRRTHTTQAKPVRTVIERPTDDENVLLLRKWLRDVGQDQNFALNSHRDGYQLEHLYSQDTTVFHGPLTLADLQTKVADVLALETDNLNGEPVDTQDRPIKPQAGVNPDGAERLPSGDLVPKGTQQLTDEQRKKLEREDEAARKKQEAEQAKQDKERAKLRADIVKKLAADGVPAAEIDAKADQELKEQEEKAAHANG